MIVFYKCRTCKLYIPEQQLCQLMPQMQGRITPDDFCSQHMAEINVCEMCGNGLLQPLIEVREDGQPHTYCPNCLMMREQQEWAMQQQPQPSGNENPTE